HVESQPYRVVTGVAEPLASVGMTLGTWGEWAAAFGTVLAAVIALYLGARDDEARRERLAARRRLRALAETRLRAMDQWCSGIAEPDGTSVTNSTTLDSECAAFHREVVALGTYARRRGLRILRTIYGERSVTIAELYPEREGGFDDTMRLVTKAPNL